MVHSVKTHLLALILPSRGNFFQSKLERDGEPAIYHLNRNDEEMNDAVTMACQTLHKFNEALESGNPDFHFFALKKQFKTSNQTEHIWITDVRLKENKYVGVVSNLPEFANDVKLGDVICVEEGNISDWMYIDKGMLMGGYTIRVLRKRMTRSQRKHFDNINGITVEE